jgi:2',3'-cyclic-nucleotide 2'-phosphodiesterase (5'-nucleotidase family)
MMLSAIVLLALCLPTVLSLTSPALVNQQPEAPNPPPERRRPLEWGSINFLHTTDVHVLFLHLSYQY